CRNARTRSASRAPSALLSLADVEHGEERLLRHLDGADLLHPLLPRLLLLEQLPFAGDVAAVALGEHVLPLRLHRLPRDDPGADPGLDRDVEHLPRDLFAQLVDEQPPAVVREIAVDDEGERVDGLIADEDIDADERARLETGEVVVEGRIAPRARLELVVVVED